VIKIKLVKCNALKER